MHIILFFTYEVSLKDWAETGLLQREIRLYQELVQKGVKVTFITYGDKEDYNYEDELNGIEIVPLYAFSPKVKSRMLRFLQSFFLAFLLKQFLQKANLYKTNQIWGGWNAVISKWLYKKPLLSRCGFEAYQFSIYQKRSVFFLVFLKFMSKLTYHFGDRVHVSSIQDKQFIEEVFKIPSKKINVQMNWINTQRFAPERKTKNHRVLFIGRLTSQKNIFILLDAIRLTSYKLDIIGDGEQKKELEQYALQHDIKASFLGKIPNDQLPAIINRYPVFILPSQYEGNPKALLEAMACGRAVIGTDVSGINNIIEHEKNGLLCQPDADSIRNTIMHVMENPVLQKTIGEQAREYVIQNCSLQHYVEKELELYQELIES